MEKKMEHEMETLNVKLMILNLRFGAYNMPQLMHATISLE